MAHAVFYTHQTSGTYAGVCACSRTDQMEKTESKSHSGRFRHVHTYSNISRDIGTYSGTIRHILRNYSDILWTWHIQNPGILRTRGIFRTQVYSELWHIRNSGTFRTVTHWEQGAYCKPWDIENPGMLWTLACWEPESYSEPCQISMVEHFAKIVTAIIIFANHSYFAIAAFHLYFISTLWNRFELF